MENRKFGSLIDELLDYTPVQSRDLIIEARAAQVIASAVNLLRLVSESYDPATADDLSKRLVRAIATGDGEKFLRRVRAIRESRDGQV